MLKSGVFSLHPLDFLIMENYECLLLSVWPRGRSKGDSVYPSSALVLGICGSQILPWWVSCVRVFSPPSAIGDHSWSGFSIPSPGIQERFLLPLFQIQRGFICALEAQVFCPLPTGLRIQSHKGEGSGGALGFFHSSGCFPFQVYSIKKGFLWSLALPTAFFLDAQ